MEALEALTHLILLSHGLDLLHESGILHCIIISANYDFLCLNDVFTAAMTGTFNMMRFSVTLWIMDYFFRLNIKFITKGGSLLIFDFGFEASF